jgi:hypothetical protein
MTHLRQVISAPKKSPEAASLPFVSAGREEKSLQGEDSGGREDR